MAVSNRTKRSSEYNSWRGMCSRCRNPNASNYAYYGGRGITVYDAWNGPGGFDLFLLHVGLKPSKNHTIERIEGSKGYEPGNVRWATRAEQSRNRPEFCVYVTYLGKKQTLAEWGRELGIHYETLRARYKRGLPLNLLFKVGHSVKIRCYVEVRHAD